MNSKWQIHRVGLVDFWYYDEEEFDFLDGRMLLRGANGSGKSVTMQSFIPLLLDGNMRPERLDPFGSRARKMENYLLEEGDDREERTGYLYMELKRKESGEYLTLGIGMRARRNKKLDSWYFCITDGRRVGKDFWLYKDRQSKITCTMRELKNRIGEGGKVMETQAEYAQCVNRLLFGFETQEEYKELLDLLIQLRTPKLSKDFKPTVINEILSSSLQTLSEEDLRPMSEAIENMDSLKTNLDTLKESIRGARQIEKVYDQYNEILLYDKALLFTKAVKEYKELEKEGDRLEERQKENRKRREEEEQHYQDLSREEEVLSEERKSLGDSDAARLKEQELKIRQELEETEKTLRDKERQEEEKKDKRLETEGRRDRQTQKNEELWEEIRDCLEEMEELMEDVPFDDFSFMKSELEEKREEPYSFKAHGELLKDYRRKVEKGREILAEEKSSQERYSRLLLELDQLQEEKNGKERELLQYENQLHEIRQELTEEIYRWAGSNQELCPEEGTLQEISRRIQDYTTGTDYWEIRNLTRSAFEQRQKEISEKKGEKQQELREKKREGEECLRELEEWRQYREPEPAHSEEVERSRQILKEKGIPFFPFYKLVDFDSRLDEKQAARLEEALLRMGILDALIIPQEYREQVLQGTEGVCDRYIFTDARRVKENLMELLDIENGENDILLYQNVSGVLSAIGWRGRDKEGEGDLPDSREGSWIDERGTYGMGVLEGTITGTYTPRYIGASSREEYRRKKICELEEQQKELEEEIGKLAWELEALEKREEKLEEEWSGFPKEQDLKIAAREYERREERLKDLTEKIQSQREHTEEERKVLEEIRSRAREICQKCYLAARLELFQRALELLRDYQDALTKLQVTHGAYVNGVRSVKLQEEYLEDIAQDLDDIRYELGGIQRNRKALTASLASVAEQLKLTDYEKIQARLNYCLERLSSLPGEKEESVREKSRLDAEDENLSRLIQENLMEKGKKARKKERLSLAFEKEYRLGYVERGFPVNEDMEDQAGKVCAMLAGRFGNKKQSDYFASLQEVYHRNRGSLLEYQITLRTLFEELDEDTDFLDISMKRIDISAKYRGTAVKFKELLERMTEDAETQQRLLSDKDRELFEDILTNTISKKIRARIQASKRWVEKMNGLMESMETSSGLTLSLKWKNKRADKEEQLDTRALVELLQKDAEIMRPEEGEKLSRHFRSKIEEARKAAGDSGNLQSFHAIMREVLDYRQWFEFQLECQKTGEKRRELTDRVFFTFSGGEKAMAMYVPLFSAVVAKYAGARQDAPRLISLDEAFAGVDEMNIRDMFRLMVEFDFNFMINSQILWGDYDTVPALAIYQLVRPENAKYVTVIPYIWNGKVKSMVKTVR